MKIRRKAGVGVLPPGADRRHNSLRQLTFAAVVAPTGITAVEHDPLHPLGMTHRIHDRDRRPLRNAEQRETLDPRSIDHGLKVRNPAIDRELIDIPVRQPTPALVVAHDRMRLTEPVQPVAPHGTLPIVLKVREPIRGLDQRGTHSPRSRALPLRTVRSGLGVRISR